MFEKIVVTAGDMHPIYKYLTDKATNPEFGGKITWNFNKFLIGRDGAIVKRFEPGVKPDAAELVAVVEQALQ